MKKGRPSKYKPEYIQKVIDYLQTCGREQTKLPKKVDIALMLGVDEDTLNNWAKKHSDFLGALSRVEMFQKSELIDAGVYGGREINANVIIFLLKANHGMIETDRHVLEGEGVMINLNKAYENNGLSAVGKLPAQAN